MGWLVRDDGLDPAQAQALHAAQHKKDSARRRERKRDGLNYEDLVAVRVEGETGRDGDTLLANPPSPSVSSGPMSPELRVFFGWLQIGEVLTIDDGFTMDEDYTWLSDHPHWREREREQMAKQNTIYVAADRLTINGEDLGVANGGIFDTFKECLQLTAPNDAHGRSDWQHACPRFVLCQA